MRFIKLPKLYEKDQPEAEPFKFKYEAKQILQKLSKVDEYESNVKGALLYFIGKINYETEDRVAAEQGRFDRLYSLEHRFFHSFGVLNEAPTTVIFFT